MAPLILHILFGCLKLNNVVDFTERDENIVEDYLCVWSYIIFASDCTYLHKWQGKLIFVTYWSYLYQNINNLHIFYEFQALRRTCRFSYFSVSSFFTFFSKLLESISYKYRTTWKLLIVTKMNMKNVLRYLHQKVIGKCWPSIHTNHLMLYGAKICGCMQHIFLQNQLLTQLVCWLVYLRIAGK